MADHQRPLELEFFDEVLNVAHLARQTVVADRRPFAVAMAALVERDAVVLAAQRQAYEIPGMRVEPAAVQEKNRMALRSTPIEVVETHSVDHDIVVLGKGETRDFEPGDLGGQLQVLELFRCFQHDFFVLAIDLVVRPVRRIAHSWILLVYQSSRCTRQHDCRLINL